MNSIRTEQISVYLTPELLARLDRYAARNNWKRSTAVAILIERGLDPDGTE